MLCEENQNEGFQGKSAVCAKVICNDNSFCLLYETHTFVFPDGSSADICKMHQMRESDGVEEA